MERLAYLGGGEKRLLRPHRRFVLGDIGRSLLILLRTLFYWHGQGGHARRSLNRGVIALLHLPEAIVVGETAAGPIRFPAISRLKHDRHHRVTEVPRARPQNRSCPDWRSIRAARRSLPRRSTLGLRGGAWRPIRVGIDPDYVIAYVHVVMSRSRFLILPVHEGCFLAFRNRFVGHFLARIDTWDSEVRPYVCSPFGGLHRNLVRMEQAPALRTLHPKMCGKFVSLVFLNPDHLAVLELGDLRIVCHRHQGLEARTEDIGSFPHDSIGIDPGEVRIQQVLQGGLVAFFESRHNSPVGLNYRIIGASGRLAGLRYHEPCRYSTHHKR